MKNGKNEYEKDRYKTSSIEYLLLNEKVKKEEVKKVLKTTKIPHTLVMELMQREDKIKEEILVFLIFKFSNFFELKDETKKTFLHLFSLFYENDSLLFSLVEKGADPNALDLFSKSPLHCVLLNKRFSSSVVLSFIEKNGFKIFSFQNHFLKLFFSYSP